MTRSGPRKSTIVRASQQRAVRLFFRSSDLVAPRLAARVARDLWFRVPSPLPAAPLPPGGTPFTLSSLGAAVRGHAWGEGPVVYLVHGWGGRGSQLTAFVEPLVAAGHRVVLFDGPAHGDSEPGPSGAGRTHGVELGHALDAVFARFGPAHAVVAHSLGTISTYLTLRYGWLSTERLVLLAPMVEGTSYLDRFQEVLGFGPRTRRAFDRAVEDFVGVPMAEFDARRQSAEVEAVPTLVVHDRSDVQTPYDAAADLVAALPDARLLGTDGLGHRRLLADPGVVRAVVAFLGADDRAVAA